MPQFFSSKLHHLESLLESFPEIERQKMLNFLFHQGVKIQSQN